MQSPKSLGFLLAAALAALALVPGRAAAQIAGPAFDTQAGARSAGLARAFAALADDPSAIRINPAGIAQAKAITIGALYQRNQDRNGDDLNQQTVSVIDSQTPLAAGLSYSIVNDNALGVIGKDYDEAPPYSLLSLALADTTVESFKFGLTLQWLRTDAPVTPAAGHDIDITLGALIPLKDWWGLQVGVVGRNLIGSNTYFLAREFDLAGAIVPWEWLRGAAAFKMDFSSREKTSAGYSAAGEVEFVKSWRVRAGFRRDAPTRDHFLGAGMGFEGTEGGLIFGYERNLSLKTNQHTIELFMRWL